MLRLALLGSALALCSGGVQAADFPLAPTLHHRRALPPPEIAYRDPAYVPAPVVRVFAPPPPTNVPLYNEPPPHFPRF